jgi:hypothetical protein
MVLYRGRSLRDDDAELFGKQAAGIRPKLQRLEKEIAEVEAIKARDPYSYSSPPVIHLPSLYRLRSEYRHQLRMAEGGLKEAGGGTKVEEWKPTPNGYFTGENM